jgi:hypothetical protein
VVAPCLLWADDAGNRLRRLEATRRDLRERYMFAIKIAGPGCRGCLRVKKKIQLESLGEGSSWIEALLRVRPEPTVGAKPPAGVRISCRP